jgi:hypothetical protein
MRRITSAPEPGSLSYRLHGVYAVNTKTETDRLLLPNFLGLGAPRCGTTWLHKFLATHPDVLMSTRKEMNFFNSNYERGLEWYSQSFCLPSNDCKPKAVGEITPIYLYGDECRERIRASDFVDRYIVCLRNPVDRFLSSFQKNSAVWNLDLSISEFMEQRSDVVQQGFYAKALKPWFDMFDRERFLLLRFDEMVTEISRTKHQLGSFLGIDPERFPPDAGRAPVNYTYRRRFPRLYSVGLRTKRRIRDAGFSWVIDLGTALGLRKLRDHFKPPPRSTEFSREVRKELQAMYMDDLKELEELTGFRVDTWLA